MNIKIIDSNNAEWDEIVRSFREHDVYYLSGYVRAFQLHGDGAPRLLYYNTPQLRAVYVYMMREIDENCRDIITPYGYGGVLFEGDTSAENVRAFQAEFLESMREQKIVCNFVRFHPVLGNANANREICNVIDLGQTIAIDLTSPETVWENITSKNRNMIRKAEKNGIEIKHGRGMDLFDKFIGIYNATMDHDNAEAYYYFKRDFYESIHRDLAENYEMFYAVHDGKIIAMSIMLFENGQMHYHLSGSVYEHRNLAPTNLLLFKVASWGIKKGFRTLHLGGGG